MIDLARITSRTIQDSIDEFKNCQDDDCRRKTDLYEYIASKGHEMSMAKLRSKDDMETLDDYVKNVYIKYKKIETVTCVIIEFEYNIYANLLIEGGNPSGGKYNHVMLDITTDKRIMDMCYSFCNGEVCVRNY